MVNPKTSDWNKILLTAGIFLILSGSFHFFIQILDPREWESSIGWRKPILFGISTGITLISLAWVISRTMKNQILAILLAILATAEVMIITVQTWRKVPAHFNNGASADQFLANSIDVMLVLITLVIFYSTFLCFRKKFGAAELDYDFSMRWGMAFLALSCIFGFGVAIYGNLMLENGQNPEIIAPGGVPKFVHGIALHALQIFPIWTLLLRKIGVNLANRLKSLQFAAFAFLFLTVYAIWQTLNGFGRFEPNLGGAIILLFVFVGAIAALFYAVSPITRKQLSCD